MKSYRALLLVGVALASCSGIYAATIHVPADQPMIPNPSTTLQQTNQMPLSFTKNMGQWDDRVLFRANAGGATMWFTKEGVTYQFTRHVASAVGAALAAARYGGPSAATAGDREGRPYNPGDRFSDDRDSIEQLVLTAKFVGANANPEVVAEGQMEYKCNYFLGNDPSKWHTDVPNYEAITLKDIYPGIDLKYSGDVYGQAAYEFIVAPSADIAQIKVEYEGAEETSIDAEGRLILKTKWGDMIAAIKSPTNGVLSGTGSFSQLSENAIGFRTEGSNRQALGTLAVQLVYSTYLGGSGYDKTWGIAVSVSGDVYVTGATFSNNFPTQDFYQGTNQGSYDVFITKLSGAGNGLIYSTYLGGSGDESPYYGGVTVDGIGNAYVAGFTNSADFPTQNPYQSTYQGGVDAFVTKLNSVGNGLIYSTYLGGSGDDEGYGVAVDGSGNTYVTGITSSTDFPIRNPYQASLHGSPDIFVSKFNDSGDGLIYSTYLGGNNWDDGLRIKVDGAGNAFVVGTTYSVDFPTQNPYRASLGGNSDAYVIKLDGTGKGLIYSTYLGGGSSDYGHGIAIDSSGNAYIVGATGSSDFPTQNPYQATYQGGTSTWGDAFVVKLNSAGSGLVYGTYLGGSADDDGRGIAVDGSGNAYVTGYTYSSNFPTQDPYQATDQGGEDAFVSKLSNTGNSLIYSTYLGGGNNDDGRGIAVDGSGDAYVTGWTLSSDFPALNPYQTDQGDWDAFVTKLSPPEYLSGDANGDATVDISDVVFLIAYIFSGGLPPNPLVAGDANCDSTVDISDAVYLIAYIFSGGPAPCGAF